MDTLVFYIHILATFYMTGVIWIVQTLHYPSYNFINRELFSQYQNFHTRRITYIVGPVMVIEAFSALYLLIHANWELHYILNFSLLMLTWVSTALFSVPSHEKLLSSYKETTINFLTRTNWIRTLCWSIRAILLMYIVYKKENL